MGKHSKSGRDGFAGFEEAFASENRRSKLIVMICAVVLGAGITIAFVKTLYHLGSLNAYVPGVFEFEDEEAKPGTQPGNTEYPRLDR